MNYRRNSKYRRQPPKRQPPKGQPPKNMNPRRKINPVRINGAKRYNEYLQREIYRKEPKAETKGTLPLQDLETPLEDKDNLYLAALEKEAKAKKKADIIRKTLFFISCVLFSLLLSILSFRIPLTPSRVIIEFSVFGELLAALCLNPIAGVAVIILKSLIHLLFTLNVPNVTNKMILDLIFVLLTYFIFCRTMNSKFVIDKMKYRSQNDLPIKDYSANCILFAGAVSSLITGLASVLTTQHVLLPLLYRFYPDKGATYSTVLIDYQNAFDGLTRYVPDIKKVITSMDNLKTGLLLYNFPLNVFKFFVCTVAAAFVYPILNRYANRD